LLRKKFRETLMILARKVDNSLFW